MLKKNIFKKNTQLMVYKPLIIIIIFFLLRFFGVQNLNSFWFKKIFFFKHKLHTSQILNFSQYLLKCLDIYRNDLKFFQSKIRSLRQSSWGPHCSHQTSFKTGQPNNAWITSSTPTWQRSQVLFRITFLV